MWHSYCKGGKKKSCSLLRNGEVIKQVCSRAADTTWWSTPGSSPLAVFIVSSVSQRLPLHETDREKERGSGGISNRDAKLSDSKSGSSSLMVSHQEETPFCDFVASTGYFHFHQSCLIWSSRFEAFNIQFSFHLLWLFYLFVFLGSFQGYVSRILFSFFNAFMDRHPNVKGRKKQQKEREGGKKEQRIYSFRGQKKKYIQFGKTSNLWLYRTALLDKIKNFMNVPFYPWRLHHLFQLLSASKELDNSWLETWPHSNATARKGQPGS